MTRDNKGRFIKGSKGALGNRHTKKTKEEIGKAVKQQWVNGERNGYPCTKETKKKMSEVKKGKIPKNIKLFTENGKSTRFKKGSIPWSKGKKLSEETKRKISEANKGNPAHQYWKGKKRSEEDKKKMGEPKKGKKLTREHIEKILKGRQKYYLSGKPTSIEKKVYDELVARGILFEKQRLINGKFVVDAYIPSLNLVIECDGDYWHNREDVKKHDKSKNAYLTKCGFNLLRLTGTEIRDDSFKEKLDMEVN